MKPTYYLRNRHQGSGCAKFIHYSPKIVSNISSTEFHWVTLPFALSSSASVLSQYHIGRNTKVVVYVSCNIKIDCASTMENVT